LRSASGKKGWANEAAAREAFFKAKDFCERTIKHKPDEADARVQLAKTFTPGSVRRTQPIAGRPTRDAIAAGKEKMRVRRSANHCAGGEVYAILGDNDRAIQLLEGLMSRPSDVR